MAKVKKATSLCLPGISGQVPTKVEISDNQACTLHSILMERIEQDLPVVMPDITKCQSTSQCVLEHMRELLARRTRERGWPRWIPSDRYLQPILVADEATMCLESGDELGVHFASHLYRNRVNLGDAMHKLDKTREGLGMAVYMAIANRSMIPGFIGVHDVISCMDEYRMQCSMAIGNPQIVTAEMLEKADEESRECLQDMGFEGEHLEAHLPSNLYREAGLTPFIGRNYQPSGPELAQDLKRAGLTQYERLAQILSHDLPFWERILRGYHSLQSDAWTMYLGDLATQLNVVIMMTTEEQSASREYSHGFIEGFIDEVYQDHMNNGEYDAPLAVDRVPKKVDSQGNPAPPLKSFGDILRAEQLMGRFDLEKSGLQKEDLGDGLLLSAVVLAAWSAMDEAISILKDYEK